MAYELEQRPDADPEELRELIRGGLGKVTDLEYFLQVYEELEELYPLEEA